MTETQTAIIPAADGHPVVPVVVRTSPFERSRIDLKLREGLSLAEMVLGCEFPAEVEPLVVVLVDDVEIPREAWARVRPKAGANVYVCVLPGKNKNPLTAILTLAVAVVAIAYGGPLGAAILGPETAGIAIGATTLGSIVGSAVINLVGALVIGALIPPPTPGGFSNQPLSSPSYQIMGSSNRRSPYGAIPRVFGKRRVYPVVAASPYTESVGNDQYLRMLLCPGYGPLSISDIRIGETPLAEYEGIEVEVYEGGPEGWAGNRPITLYTNTIREEPLSIELGPGPGPQFFVTTQGTSIPAGSVSLGSYVVTTQGNFYVPSTSTTYYVLLNLSNIQLGAIDANNVKPGYDRLSAAQRAAALAAYTPDSPDWVSRFTLAQSSEATFDVTFPRGLARFDDEGNRKDRTVTVKAQYRLAGSAGAWTSLADIVVTDKSSSAVRASRRIVFPSAGQWEVRLRRETEAGNNRVIDATFWTALRSVIYSAAVKDPAVCLIALRIKATEQLNGVPNQVNCIAESYLPVRLSTGVFQWRITSNPGWAYLDILRRRGRDTVVPDSRIDLDGIRAWALACEADGPNGDPLYWEFNGIVEGGSVFEALRTVAAHGRASFSIRDGKYSVVRDVAQTVPVQHITPRNSWGYQGRKQFIDLPHALKVRFINANKGYVEDERIVYDDGYDETNASRFETIELYGCTKASQAYREGRYHLAVGRLRPEEHVVSMDIEALRCTLGDLVRFSHDAVAIGLGSGRVMARVLNVDGRVTGLRLDGPVQMDATKLYGLRLRRWDGATSVLSLTTIVGQSDVVTLSTPVAVADAPDEGDLFMFGEASRESSQMLVRRIEPGPDLTARVTLVDAQTGVWTADTRAIPDFNSNITLPGQLTQQAPPTPTYLIRSDESALLRLPDGSLQDRIAVLLDPPAAATVAVGGYELQFREVGSPGWIVAPRVTADSREIFVSTVVQGTAYDVRVRAISEDGIPSGWRNTLGYTVIGKTTPPFTVTGLSAIRKVDGVQLSWTANPEIDVAGYTIKRGETWDTATTVTERFAGTSIFVGLQTSAEQQFLIRAVDVIGLLSQTPTTIRAAVVAPADVARLEAYPQGDRVRLSWAEVEGIGNLYEIREGSSWALSRLVLRAAGSTALVQWPTSTAGDRTFWIRTLSAAGLYSPNSTFATTAQAPMSDRNVVVTKDLPADGFPGVLRDLTRVTSGGRTRLVLAKDGSVNRASGEAYVPIDLGRSWYARNWIELRSAAATGTGLTWAGAIQTWADSAAATWQGTLDDATGVEAEASLLLDGYVEQDLVEGWTLAGVTTGIGGTAAATARGVRYDDGLFRQGAFVSDLTTIDWSKSVPSQFSTTLDIAAGAATADYAIVLRLAGPSGWLQLGRDGSAGVFFLEDSAGRRLEVAVPVESGDVITLGVNQSADSRSLFAATGRYPDVVADVDLFAPVGAFTTVALHA